MTLAIALKPSKRGSIGRLDVAAMATLLLVLVGAVVKMTFLSGYPLWLDEVWTGMIASQRTLSGFIRQCYLDINAPLGYVVDWIWSVPAGLSNEALRFPSRLFASIAPLVALLPSKSIGRTTRLVWCGLLSCWLPGLFIGVEARCYPLVLMLGTASTAAFARLLSRPTPGAAWTWASLSSLLILSHYVSGALVACQGLAYLATHRARAVRSWPAALAFLPAALSLGAHAALIIGFTNPRVVRVAPLKLLQAGDALGFLVGGAAEAWVVLGWCAVSAAIVGLSRTMASSRPVPASTGREETEPNARLWIVPATSLAAVALCFIINLWRPIIVARYLTASTPGILLGAAMLAGYFERYVRLAPAALVALYFGVAAGEMIEVSKGLDPFNYQFETASGALMAAGTKHLVFLWDNPSTTGGDPDAFGQVGGFFFKRAGRPIPVTWAPAVPGVDANGRLLALASAPDAAILWLYDPAIAGTAARLFPPRLAQIDPRWGCRDFGDHGQHVLACTRRWASAQPPAASPRSPDGRH